MQKHFNIEMRHLNEALLDYSQQHPEQARALNLTEKTYKDPAINRLLEGVAFMGAQIKQHLSRDIPEMSELLLQQIAPDFLMPVVATSVLQVTNEGSEVGRLAQRQKVKGYVNAAHLKQYCPFETKAQLTAYPLHIEDIQFAQSIQQKQTHIDIIMHYQGHDPLPSVLPVYIHAEHDLAYKIYALLCHHVINAQLSCAGQATYPITISGLPTLLQKEGKSLLNQLKTFFTAPEQFFYCYIHGLDQLTQIDQAQQLQLTLTTDTMIDEQTMFQPHHLRLNCVNIENAFRCTAEPIQGDEQRYEHEVVVDNNYPDFYSLIRMVTVAGIQGETIRQYKPLHALQPDNNQQQHYQVITRQSPKGHSANYISFQQPIEQDNAISCEVVASNNHYPRRYLMGGDINKLEDNTQLTVTNLHRPTPYCAFDDEGSRTWRCIAYMQLQISSLLQRDNLQSYLLMNVWQPNRRDLNQKIEAIYNLDYQVNYQLYQGVFYPVLSVTIEVNDRAFDCVSEVFFWGEWLYALFLEAMDVNHLLALRVSCPGEDVHYDWHQQHGRQYAL